MPSQKMSKKSRTLSSRKSSSSKKTKKIQKTPKQPEEPSCKQLVADYRDYITEVVRSRSDVPEVAKEQMIALFKAELKTDKYKSLQLGVSYNTVVQKGKQESVADMIEYLAEKGKNKSELEKMSYAKLVELYYREGGDFTRGAVNPDTRRPIHF